MQHEPPQSSPWRHHPPSSSPASAFDVPCGWGAAVSGEILIACDVCGRPATTSDGIVGAELCDDMACLDAAWGRAFPPDPRPCKGRNSNICVGEGCYGESCRATPAPSDADLMRQVAHAAAADTLARVRDEGAGS